MDSIEHFFSFLELKCHTGEEMENQVLLYLHEVYKQTISKCRGQSYDNAANIKILKGCIGNESILKYLSDTRW